MEKFHKVSILICHYVLKISKQCIVIGDTPNVDSVKVIILRLAYQKMG